MKKRLILAFGTFDILHPGHLKYLKEAKHFGEVLGVIVARDESVKKIKNRAAIINENDRVKMVGSLKDVDFAVLGNRIHKLSDRYKIIKKFKPNVIVFGYDQNIKIDELKTWLKENKLKTKIVKIKKPYMKGKYKSSIIKNFLET